MWSMTRRSAVAALLALALAACGDSTGPGDATGTFRLRTINGDALPYVLEQDGTSRLEITGGKRILDTDGSYIEVIRARFTVGGDSDEEEFFVSGTYERSGSAVTFVTPGGDTEDGRLDGGVLTVTVNDGGGSTLALRYEK